MLFYKKALQLLNVTDTFEVGCRKDAIFSVSYRKKTRTFIPTEFFISH